VSPAETPLQAAKRIAPLAGAYAEQIEQERSLPEDLLAELRSAGLMHMCLPRELGGGEVEPAVMIEAIEELARCDGATAWCAMIASTSSLLGAYLPEDEGQLIYGGGSAITGGVFAPRGRAERSEDGFLVSGRWSFLSGVQHCDWVMGGCIVYSGESPDLLASGTPDVRLMLMPIDSVEVIDTWSVSGLRGTGSHDMAVVELFVPASRAVSLFSDRPRVTGALYSFPLFGLLAGGIASVALGIARAAIEDLIALAAAKTPAGSSKALAQRAVLQSELAHAEASQRAARALLLEQARSAWASAAGGEPISVEQRLGLRLAASHATEVSAAVVTAMYHAGGGSSIYDTSPLQRRLRDVHVATQHMMVAPPSWELTGRLLLGLESDTSQL
jgi:alkylation response protein AidB-like acyl-CoA dehydrogenase